MEVLRDRRRFLEIDWISVDKMDKVECICRLVDLHHEEEDGSAEGRGIYNQM